MTKTPAQVPGFFMWRGLLWGAVFPGGGRDAPLPEGSHSHSGGPDFGKLIAGKRIAAQRLPQHHPCDADQSQGNPPKAARDEKHQNRRLPCQARRGKIARD